MTRLPTSLNPARLQEDDYLPAADLAARLDARALPLAPEVRSEERVKRRRDWFQVKTVRLPVVERDGQEIGIGFHEISREGDPGTNVPMIWIPGGFGVSRIEHMLYRTAAAGGRWFTVDWLGRGGSDELPHTTPAPARGAVYDVEHAWDDSYQFYNVLALRRVIDHVASREDLDQERLTVNGTSWGSFYSLLLASIDPRIRFVISSFGVGYLDLETRHVWQAAFEKMGPDRTAAWLRAFDPGRRARDISAKVFFETAANDKFFSMPSAMRTLANIPGEAHCCVLENQDHFLKPYSHQNLLVAQAIVEQGDFPALPRIEAAHWRADAGKIEATITGAGDAASVSVIYAEGDYCGSFGKQWHRVHATRPAPGAAWEARIDPMLGDRPFWWYVLVEENRQAVTSHVFEDRFPPGEEPGNRARGLRWSATDAPVDRQPVGDRIHPKVSVEGDDEGPFLAMAWDAPKSDKCVVYAIDGDIAAAEGVGQIEVECRLDGDAAGCEPWLVLVTDYHAHEEQSYGVRLDGERVTPGTWQIIRVPLAEFQPVATRRSPFRGPPTPPLAPGRLCAVGFHLTGQPTLGRIDIRRFALS